MKDFIIIKVYSKKTSTKIQKLCLQHGITWALEEGVWFPDRIFYFLAIDFKEKRMRYAKITDKKKLPNKWIIMKKKEFFEYMKSFFFAKVEENQLLFPF